MLKLINNSDTAIVVLHEIYGINKNIESKCDKLNDHGYDVFCPNLLDRKEAFNYVDEAAAYNNFIQCIGIEKPAKRIESIVKELKKVYQHVFILGFSMGATIAWLCGEDGCQDGIICFYGSRIRDYVSIEVRCPVALYFAEKEKSFDVDQLIYNLKNKRNIEEIKKYKGEHGFADEFSKNYNSESYERSYEDMLNFIAGIEQN